MLDRDRRIALRALDRTRRALAEQGWRHRTREPMEYPTREVLVEEVRVLRAERARLAALVDTQDEVIAELRDSLGRGQGPAPAAMEDE